MFKVNYILFHAHGLSYKIVYNIVCEKIELSLKNLPILKYYFKPVKPYYIARTQTHTLWSF